MTWDQSPLFSLQECTVGIPLSFRVFFQAATIGIVCYLKSTGDRDGDRDANGGGDSDDGGGNDDYGCGGGGGGYDDDGGGNDRDDDDDCDDCNDNDSSDDY